MSQSISVIIPTYNGSKYIKPTIESALSQTVPAREIIVVDDGSTDNTETIVRSFGKDITYIRQNNKGPASAYNAGIEASGGEFVALLEHDDIWMPDKNRQQLSVLQKDATIGMVYSPVELMEDDNPSKSSDIDHQAPPGEYKFMDFFIRNRVLNCSSVMIRKSLLKQTGLFRENLKLAFDYDLWLRIAMISRIICLDKPLAKYRIHDGNLSKDEHELMAAEGSLFTILFWKNKKEAIREVGKDTLNERLIRLYRRVAWDYAQMGKRDMELKHLHAAAMVDPYNLDNWSYFLWHCLDRRLRSKLSWYMQRLKNKIPGN